MLKKVTKTIHSNLHANDIMGLFCPIHTWDLVQNLMEIDMDVDTVSTESIQLLWEMHS